MTNTIYKIEVSERKGKTTDIIYEMYGVSPKALLKVINKDGYHFSKYREHLIKAVEENRSRTTFEDGDRKFIIHIDTCPLILED